MSKNSLNWKNVMIINMSTKRSTIRLCTLLTFSKSIINRSRIGQINSNKPRSNSSNRADSIMKVWMRSRQVWSQWPGVLRASKLSGPYRWPARCLKVRFAIVSKFREWEEEVLAKNESNFSIPIMVINVIPLISLARQYCKSLQWETRGLNNNSNNIQWLL